MIVKKGFYLTFDDIKKLTNLNDTARIANVEFNSLDETIYITFYDLGDSEENQIDYKKININN